MQLRTVIDRRLVAGLALAGCLVSAAPAAEHRVWVPPQGGEAPVYQRQRSIEPNVESRTRGDRPSRYHRTRHHPRGPFFHNYPPRPVIEHGAWFQRPYPYHLDYYRLRYGGTFEPYYSGGLYGTPMVVPPAVGYGYGYGYGYPSPVPEPPPPPEDDSTAEDPAAP